MILAVAYVNGRPKASKIPLHAEALYYQRPENIEGLKNVLRAKDKLSDSFNEGAFLGLYIFSGYTFFALLLFIDERRRRKLEEAKRIE